MASGVDVAGPSVQTILVRGMREFEDKATDGRGERLS